MQFFFWGLPLWIIIQELQCSKKRRVCTKNTWKSALYFYWNKPGKKRKLEYFTWKNLFLQKSWTISCNDLSIWATKTLIQNIDKFSPPMIILLARNFYFFYSSRSISNIQSSEPLKKTYRSIIVEGASFGINNTPIYRAQCHFLVLS